MNGVLLSLLIVAALTLVTRANDLGTTTATNAVEEAHAKFAVPSSITAEHEELHAELRRAIQSGGKTAASAERVAEVLHRHFQKEEEIAMPPLGLLPQISSGTVTRQMEEILPLTDKLKASLPEMLKEHKAIVVELDRLNAAAKSEDKAEVVEFVKKLKQHADQEEQILYPAALLVGEMVKEKLKR